MNLRHTLDCLEAKWLEYLRQRGHYIYKARPCMHGIRSRNGKKVRYRWLLLAGQGSKHTFNGFELSNVRRHLKQAEKLGEAAYLVVGFAQGPRRIIVLPAEAALNARHVFADRGGIAWDD